MDVSSKRNSYTVTYEDNAKKRACMWTNKALARIQEFGYGKYLIVPFWYASAAYQARMVSPWVF